MSLLSYTSSTGAIIAIDPVGVTDFAVPPTIPVLPGNGGSPFVPDYLQDGNGQTNPVNGARAGIRILNNPPLSVAVAGVIWKNPDEIV